MRFYDLEEMKRRLAELDAEREPLVRLIAAAEAYDDRLHPRSIATGAPLVGKPRVTEGKTAREITENIALERINATGKPVPTRVVINTMLERGLPLPDKNVVNVISARLSNSALLEGRRGVGWWPKGRPWPRAQEDFTHGGEDTNTRPNVNGEAEASPETGGVAAPSTFTPASSSA